MEIDPRVAFERMFGRTGTAARRAERLAEDSSILDSILGDANRLRTRVGPRDRRRLDQYFDDVREIERRIQRTAAANADRVEAIDAPLGVPDSFEEHVGLMFDLLTVAYQADLSRVFTFMMSREASQRTYPQIEIREPHHTLSHHGNDPEKIRLNAKINLYHVEQFARFARKLASLPDGDGTLLDHSLVFYGAGMGNGNAHATDPLPLVGLGGALRGNRHLDSPPKTPAANLWMSVADRFGVHLDTFGNSTAMLTI
jgi:hypothetical protein